MELNITHFFNTACPRGYSASVAEIGQNAGRDTWNAALDSSEDYMLLDIEAKREAFEEFILGFGAWDSSDIAAWSIVELNALCIQFISGDIRESMYLDKSPIDWDAYEKEENAGRIFRGIDGEIYFYIGS